MSIRSLLSARIESAPRRDLYYFALYRLLIASLLTAMMFSPLMALAGAPRWPGLAGGVALGYLLTSALLLALGRYPRRLSRPVIAGSLADILAAILTIHALPNASDGISMMLLFNLAATATLLPLRPAMTIAAIAGAGQILEYVWSRFDGGPVRPLAELAMVIASYLALSHMFHHFSQRARRNQALAEHHSAEAARLYEINGLIIRRLRTGVLLVDGRNRITLANEAAVALLDHDALSADDGRQREPQLGAVAPELARRLQRWRGGWTGEESPLRLATGPTEVQPRFTRLLADSDLTLVFLDDTRVVSRRAESLTLSAMGRFSASLAHEIRNPLAAINYAVQLLEESDAIGDDDQRLLRIIHQQCQRSNGIVESVLGLARRERARPEHLDLGAFVVRFVDEYRQTMALEPEQLRVDNATATVHALADPRHVQQILTALIDNALKYGRTPTVPARVRVTVASVGRGARIEVSDQGPGIAAATRAQLFEPFFTTSEHGTGMGLYIAQELCHANQARLDHHAPDEGGTCFRITLPGTDALRTG